MSRTTYRATPTPDGSWVMFKDSTGELVAGFFTKEHLLQAAQEAGLQVVEEKEVISRILFKGGGWRPKVAERALKAAAERVADAAIKALARVRAFSEVSGLSEQQVDQEMKDFTYRMDGLANRLLEHWRQRVAEVGVQEALNQLEAEIFASHGDLSVIGVIEDLLEPVGSEDRLWKRGTPPGYFLLDALSSWYTDRYEAYKRKGDKSHAELIDAVGSAMTRAIANLFGLAPDDSPLDRELVREGRARGWRL